MTETIAPALLLCREVGFGERIFGFLWEIRPPLWGSPSCFYLQRGVLASCPGTAGQAATPRVLTVGCTRAHVCWHLASVAALAK